MDDDDRQRREIERSNRQVNSAGQTTMISPLARLMTTSLRKTTAAQTASAKLYVDSCITARQNAITIFGKSTCPRCQQARELISSVSATDVKGDSNVVFYVDLESVTEHNGEQLDMIAIQDYLWDLTGCRTVPRIFMTGVCIGGYDDVKIMHEEGMLLAPVTVALAAALPLAPF